MRPNVVPTHLLPLLLYQTLINHQLMVVIIREVLVLTLEPEVVAVTTQTVVVATMVVVGIAAMEGIILANINNLWVHSDHGFGSHNHGPQHYAHTPQQARLPTSTTGPFGRLIPHDYFTK